MRRLVSVLLLACLSLPASVRAAEVLDSASFSLSQFAGAKVIYLDFWASWCVPCRHSFPWLNAMQHKYGKYGLVIVGINVDPDPADAHKFLRKYPADFPLVMDPKGELAEKWKLQGMPSAVILDPQGHELHRHIGFRSDHAGDYEQIVRKLLADAEKADAGKAQAEKPGSVNSDTGTSR